jgi:hypothetical protein
MGGSGVEKPKSAQLRLTDGH